MRNSIGGLIFFGIGAFLGAVATYAITRNKCDREVGEMKQFYEDRYNEKLKKTDEAESAAEEISEKVNDSYEEVLTDYSYQKTFRTNDIFVISPEEFGANESYSVTTIYYDAERNLLMDSDRTEVESPDDLIGKDALKHFGEYERDSVKVRNDSLELYIEILLVYDDGGD